MKYPGFQYEYVTGYTKPLRRALRAARKLMRKELLEESKAALAVNPAAALKLAMLVERLEMIRRDSTRDYNSKAMATLRIKVEYEQAVAVGTAEAAE
jgi:hypothetical protein